MIGYSHHECCYGWLWDSISLIRIGTHTHDVLYRRSFSSQVAAGPLGRKGLAASRVLCYGALKLMTSASHNNIKTESPVVRTMTN